MSFSIWVDWREEFEKNSEKWTNESRRVAQAVIGDKEHESYKQVAENYGIDDDTQYPEDVLYDYMDPMMNYAYPLETSPDDDVILKATLETNCCVMYNDEENKYYLALTGGGMDLSQDIALAYNIIEKWIPYDLATSICTQPAFSVSKKKWNDVLLPALKESLGLYKDRADRIIDSLKKAGDE